MSKEEAIKEIKLYKEYVCGGLEEAFNVAIASMEKLAKIEKLMEGSNE